jgi:hypothetical protein
VAKLPPEQPRRSWLVVAETKGGEYVPCLDPMTEQEANQHADRIGPANQRVMAFDLDTLPALFSRSAS